MVDAWKIQIRCLSIILGDTLFIRWWIILKYLFFLGPVQNLFLSVIKFILLFNNDTDEQVSQTLHNQILIPSQSKLSLQNSISTPTSTTISMSQDDGLDTCSLCLQKFQRGRGMAIHRSSCLKKKLYKLLKLIRNLLIH